MKESWQDSELGTIRLVLNTRARGIIMRAEAGGIRVTVPPHTSFKKVVSMMEEYRERLKSMRKSAEENYRRIDFGYSIETDVMSLHLVPCERTDVQIKRSMGVCTIECPHNIDFDSLQDRLRDIIIEQLRAQAKVYLHKRTLEIAKQYGFRCSAIRIQSSRTRWGSCSGRNSINLSLFLMAVPSRLSDYVIKHELCHTVHHDHSDAFWRLMDKVTDNKARQLRKELAGYTKEVL